MIVAWRWIRVGGSRFKRAAIEIIRTLNREP
jgi:hypothetical protein